MCIECNKYFDFEIKHLTLHPSGFYLLAASESHLYFIHILIGDLIIFKKMNFSKTRVMQFSHGGQFFALSNDKNLLIYEFHKEKMEPIIIFEGHDKQVNNMLWSPDDLTIYSSDTSGRILEWELEKFQEFKQYNEFKNMIDTFDLTFDYSNHENFLGKHKACVC
jgi:WD40 repeat protein